MSWKRPCLDTDTPKGGARATMEEVGLYTVRDGKISEERFFYGAS